MNEDEELDLSEFYNEGYHSTGVGIAKLLLMPFVFIALLGFPTAYGSYVSSCCSFAGAAFFMFCGFFTLSPDRTVRMGKLKRAFKRSLLVFAILFVAYLAISIAYLAYSGSLGYLTSVEFLRKRTIFEFLVFNIWPLPIGTNIWFIQSLVYAYAFFIIMEKLKLSKLYVPIMILLLVVAFAGGEFAGLTGFPYFGYSYIPGGAITKAIPYMLVGMLIRKYVDYFMDIPWYGYLIGFFVGAGCTIGEYLLLQHFGLLVYSGNTIGHVIMAISVVGLAVNGVDTKRDFWGLHGGNYSRRMYALCQPVSFLVWFVFRLTQPEALSTVRKYDSLISFVICLVLSILIGVVKLQIVQRKLDAEKTD